MAYDPAGREGPVAKRASGLPEWLSNPWIGLVGVAVGVLATLLVGAFFYFLGQKTRRVMFYVNPVKAIVLSRAGVSDLRVIFRNQEIQGDVTAAQVEIWNHGAEPVRQQDILSDIKIVTDPKVAILRATIRKVSRPVVGFTTDEKHFADGLVPVSWKILEQNDWAVIQLIYAGATDVKISVEGVVEGQRKVTVVPFSGKIVPPEEQLSKQRLVNVWLNVYFGAILGFTCLGAGALLVVGRKTFSTRMLTLMALPLIATALAAAYSLLAPVMTGPAPPFAF